MMTIQLTENAAKQIRTQLAKRGKGVGLRVGIKKVGCSGWTYTYDYADEVKADDKVFEAYEPGIHRRVKTRFRQRGFEANLQVRQSECRRHLRLRREF
jgi:iron-sulfur cluster assembly accessory protein